MIESICFILAAPVLLLIGVEDGRTFRIPDRYNRMLAVLGILNTVSAGICYGPDALLPHLAGAIVVSGPLYGLFLASKGTAIGGGDIKLMAAAGLLLGWRSVLLGFAAACVLGTVIHGIRMKLTGCGRRLAFGPYLAAGIIIAMAAGDKVIDWYGKFY